MDSKSKSRPPKLGPRKTSTQRSENAASQSTGKPSMSEKPANKSRPPKLGPRKSSSQVHNPADKKAATASHPPTQNVESEALSMKIQPLKGIPKLPPRQNRSSGKQSNVEPQSQQAEQDGGEEQSLTTILGPRQRTQLIILLAAATATMRDSLSGTFDAMGSSSGDLSRSSNITEDEKIMNPNVDPGTADVAAHDKERKAIIQRQKEVSSANMQKLRVAAEEWFDSWREAVIGRVGEVLNSSKDAKGQLKNQETEDAKPNPRTAEDKKISPGEEDETRSEPNPSTDANLVLRSLYPPVKTSLAKLEHKEKVMVLHSVLLLLLSMETYAAASRILLLYLMSSLDLSLETLKQDEDETAQGLLQAAKELSGSSEATKKAKENEKSRKWKVGLASVAGAAIVGVTGSMAAPLVAAGVTSVMGGLGLGSTAAAGYLGSVAGSTMLVGSLFGAYGGRMTGQMMDNYAKEVSDFAFIPVHSQEKHLMDSNGKGESAEAEAGKKDPASRRLRVTVGISGWLTEKEEVVSPWTVLSHGSEAFALRWELETLMNLGNAMTELVSSAAWGYAQKQLISQTIFAELSSAMWPIALVKVARVVDNPFSVAKSRAEKAGEVLADALVNHAQGQRPISLIGYSLGARVIYSCLMNLAARKAFGLIENVVLIGAPVPNKSAEWRRMRAVVTGRLVNVYSENDYVLGFLYRTSSAQYAIAGLQRVEGVPGLENVDVSETVSGHLRYRFMVGSILKQIGFEDLDYDAIAREEENLRNMDEEERKRTEELKKKLPSRKSEEDEEIVEVSEADAEEEADKMEQSVQNRTKASMMQRGAELLHLNGSNKDGASAESPSYLSYVTPNWSSKRKNKDTKDVKGKVEQKPGSQERANPTRVDEKSYLTMASEKLYGSNPDSNRHAEKIKQSPQNHDDGASEITTKKEKAKEAGSPTSYMQKAVGGIPSFRRK